MSVKYIPPSISALLIIQ